MPKVTDPLAQRNSRVPVYVYFIHCGPYVKIGKTCDLDRRVAEIRNRAVGCRYPEDLDPAAPIQAVTYVFGGGDVERAVHDAFSDLRVRGEWFAATPRLLAWCSRRKPGVVPGAS